MIGAMALDGFRGFMTIDAGTSNDVFDAFVEAELAPNLRPTDIVVMDNLSAHKSPSIQSRIYAAGASILYTPPYSPDLNPIEEAWAKLKDVIRRLSTRTRDAFDVAVASAIDTITPNDIQNWIEYAGYSINSS
jgi:transposase